MSKTTKTILTVLLTLVAVAVLVGGGYALYRWGYARGMAADCGGLLWEGWGERLSGDWDRPELGEHIMPWAPHSRMLPYSSRLSFNPFWWVGGLFGLLLGGGVLALAVYGVIQLVRSNQKTAQKD